ncbi:hypothetical protein FACS1894181_09250 [Bacteroidia bacterium]|nr:hypothetical protein FACS1894181_09250 [Bacteroidia bacterium]
MNLPTGHTLQYGKYQLLQVVGQGGFGITYKGILTEVKGQLGSIRSEVPICIKEYFFKDYCYRNPGTLNIEVHSSMGQQLFHRFKEKLIKEARILSEVNHPNIVNVLDVFEENNTAYIAMEYIEGHSLKYILGRDGILPEQKVLRYISQVSNALQFVHGKNILHLDIKPSNILIDKRDNARLIDFGISKRYDTEDRETSTTMLTLSKGFASIEQYDNEGTHTFSPCPDIYSLGATIYNLLTGKIPTESILRATRPFPNPTELNPAISPKTEAVILKAMQINPADRYQTVSEMMAALDVPLATGTDYLLHENIEQPIDNDDSTIHYPLKRPSVAKDDEQTIARNNHRISKKRKKKRRKTILLVSILCTFATIGTSLFFLMGKSPVGISPFHVENTGIDSTGYKGEITLPQERGDTMNVKVPEIVPSENRQEQIQQPEEIVATTLDTASLSIEKVKEFEYLALRASGDEKMKKEDFSGALDDYSKANKINPTDEIAQLMMTSSAKKEEKERAEKRAQYEEKMAFGRLMIVRKKYTDGTSKYGAIDDKVEEVIPCIYKNSEPAGNGLRAFQREDNDSLYDIYNSAGVLMKGNVPY